jgi:hypothetical protein
MKLLLIIILAVSFTWSFNRVDKAPDVRVVSACPCIEDLEHHSWAVWTY